MAEHDWKPAIRALTYPILFSTEPVDDIDRVVAMLDRGHLPMTSRAEALEAITLALASGADLLTVAGALPTRSGDQLRRFLTGLRERLEQRR
jgi:hypothetical protein